MDENLPHRVIHLAGVRVDLLRVSTTEAGMLDRLRTSASPERLAQAARYRFEADAIRCLASEAALRSALREEHQLDLHTLSRSVTPLGKPFLADHPHIHFSLSHSESWVACALAGSPVGIDVEAVRPMDDPPSRQFMSPAELSRHQGLDRVDRQVDFFRLWTMKESVVKAMGTGFTVDPRRITLRVDPAGTRVEGADTPCDGAWWDVQALEMPPGVVGAVCVLRSRAPAGHAPNPPAPVRTDA